MKTLRAKYLDWYAVEEAKLGNTYFESFSRYLEENKSLYVILSDDWMGSKIYTVDNTFQVYTYAGSGNTLQYGLSPIHTKDGTCSDGILFNDKDTVFKNLVTEIRKASSSSKVYKTSSNLTTSNLCYVYLQELTSPNVMALKYGVANEPVSRMKDQSDVSLFTHKLLYTVCLENRKEALSLEEDIKAAFGGYYCDKAWIPDGYTETVPHSNLQGIIDFIEARIKS